MRLFLLILAVIGYTLIPLAIDARIERHLRSNEGNSRLERAYLTAIRPLARLLDLISVTACRLRLFSVAERTEHFLLGYHFLSKSLGTIDYVCAELAPGWWDFDVDCAMHNCGTCMECQHRNPTVLDMAGYHREGAAW